jgi:transposase
VHGCGAFTSCRRTMSVPSVGLIVSSAMVAAIGTGEGFCKGRDFAAWLGIMPKQISTGDRTILGSISKRGNKYQRKLFVQAAWVVLVKPMSWERHDLKSWIEAAKKRLHRNVLAIALANKLARIAWAVLAKGRGFEVTRKTNVATQYGWVCRRARRRQGAAKTGDPDSDSRLIR